MYLYDTNIVSELTKKQPNINVVTLIERVKADNIPCYLSVISVGEIIRGIEKVKRRNDLPQAEKLQYWYDKQLKTAIQSILPFSEQCAKIWGKLLAENPHHPIDKQLVATALVHDLCLVTRNVKDIEATGVKFINPFDDVEQLTDLKH